MRTALADFLAGAPLMPLWMAVMDATNALADDPALTDADRD